MMLPISSIEKIALSNRFSFIREKIFWEPFFFFFFFFFEVDHKLIVVENRWNKRYLFVVQESF